MATLPFVLYDGASEPFTITDIVLNSYGFTDSITKPLPITLEPGDSLRLFITFSPKYAQDYAAQLIVIFNDNTSKYSSVQGYGQVKTSKGVVSENNATNSIAIYPNPASDEATITPQGASSLISRVTIYDLLGQVVADNVYPDIAGRSITVSLRTIPAGVYSLAVTLGGKEIRQTIVKP